MPSPSRHFDCGGETVTTRCLDKLGMTTHRYRVTRGLPVTTARPCAIDGVTTYLEPVSRGEWRTEHGYTGDGRAACEFVRGGAVAIERRLTIDDLPGVALPDRWELVDGEVIALSPSGNRSSRIGGTIYGVLLVDGQRAGHGTAYPADAGFVLFPDRRTVRGPDAAFVVAARAVPLADPAFVPFAPDFVAEVLSPSDRIGEAIAKMGMYLEAGVRLAWLVHPERQTVTVFTPDAPPVTLVPGAVLDGGDVLPWLSLPVADLFAG